MDNIDRPLGEGEPLPIRKSKRRMRLFTVTSETIQFKVEARSINSAFNRAARRLGQGRQIVVQGSDRVLTGSVPIES